MKKKGCILLLVLVCVAFLVSCGKKASGDGRQGELVWNQAEDGFSSAFFRFWDFLHKAENHNIDL